MFISLACVIVSEYFLLSESKSYAINIINTKETRSTKDKVETWPAKPSVLETIVNKLLNGEDISIPDKQILSQNDCIVGRDYFVVCLIGCFSYQNPDYWYYLSEEQRGLQIDTMREFIDGLDFEKANGLQHYAVERGEGLAVVFGWNSANDAAASLVYSSIQNSIHAGLDVLNTGGKNKYVGVLGCIETGPQYIHYSYSRALGWFNKSEEMNSYPLLAVEDIDIRQKSIQQKIIRLDMVYCSYVVSKRPVNALETMLEIYNIEAYERAYPIVQLRAFAREKFNILMRVLGYSTHMMDFGDDYWRKRVSAINLAESVEKLYDVLKEILLDFVQLEEEESSARGALSDYARYISEKFTDPSLNVQTVCDHFELLPSQISRLFKREYGMGALEYIHKMRIDYAKKLLEETEKQIDDIAEECGFYTRRAFDAVFKRYMGISPKTYRESMTQCQGSSGI